MEDKHSTPADVATTRIDFADWLESLPERTRHVAETLATGETTACVARMFGLSASRISQLRRELYQAWRVFQGEVAPATSSILGLISALVAGIESSLPEDRRSLPAPSWRRRRGRRAAAMWGRSAFS